jgi:hypothetical protein
VLRLSWFPWVLQLAEWCALHTKPKMRPCPCAGLGRVEASGQLQDELSALLKELEAASPAAAKPAATAASGVVTGLPATAQAGGRAGGGSAWNDMD